MALFTPFAPNSARRLKMDLSVEDSAKIPNRGYWGPVEVTDVPSGTVVLVQSADCGAGCHCAAEVIEVVRAGDTVPYFD
jgi:hypothetical protein